MRLRTLFRGLLTAETDTINAPTMTTERIHTFNTVAGQTYCITAKTPCTIYADIKGEPIPLTSTQGGQAFFVAPGKEVYADAPCAFTKCFKGAAPTAQGSGGNNTAYPYVTITDTGAVYPMAHLTWYRMEGNLTQIVFAPQENPQGIVETVLLLTPQNDSETGWLQTTEGNSVIWVYGEMLPKFGYTYEILLTQRSQTEITAYVTAVTPTPEY